MSAKYPKHAFPNARAFKVKKRADLRKALAAVHELFLGSAYLPEGELVNNAQELLRKARESMSVKNWGR